MLAGFHPLRAARPSGESTFTAVVYTATMRRIQLYMDDDLDVAIDLEAARSGSSRSDVVRTAVRHWLGQRGGDGPDPIDGLVGALDIDPVEDIDAAIYDR